MNFWLNCSAAKRGLLVLAAQADALPDRRSEMLDQDRLGERVVDSDGRVKYFLSSSLLLLVSSEEPSPFDRTSIVLVNNQDMQFYELPARASLSCTVAVECQ